MDIIKKKVLRLIKLTQAADPDKIIDDQIAAVERGSTELVSKMKPGWKERLKKTANPEVLKEMIIPIYEEHYSEKELDALISFYRSPIGRKLVRTSTEMFPKITAIIQKYMSNVLESLFQEVGL